MNIVRHGLSPLLNIMRQGLSSLVISWGMGCHHRHVEHCEARLSPLTWWALRHGCHHWLGEHCEAWTVTTTEHYEARAVIVGYQFEEWAVTIDMLNIVRQGCHHWLDEHWGMAVTIDLVNIARYDCHHWLGQHCEALTVTIGEHYEAGTVTINDGCGTWAVTADSVKIVRHGQSLLTWSTLSGIGGQHWLSEHCEACHQGMSRGMGCHHWWTLLGMGCGHWLGEHCQTWAVTIGDHC